jgi:hypothetical protein
MTAGELRIGYRPLRVYSHRASLAPRLRRMATTMMAIDKLQKPSTALGILLDGPDTELLTAVRMLAAHDLSVSVTNRDTTTLHGKGLDMRLNFTRSLPIAVRGRVRGSHLWIDSWRIDKPGLHIRASASDVDLQNAVGRVYGGSLKAAANIEPAAGTIRDGTIRLENVDLERLYESRAATIGRIAGTADITLTLSPSALHRDSLHGEGRLECRDVTLDSIPPLNTIVIASSFPFLRQTHFERIRGRIQLAREGVYCDSLEGRGVPLDMLLTGWMRSDEGFDFQVLGTFAPHFADSVSSIVWNAMHPTENDGRTFLCTVSGTFYHPRVSVDRSVRRRAVRGVFKTIGQNLRNAFGGGDDKDQ